MQLLVKNFAREYRTKNKITQVDLVNEIGVTRQTIIAIEKGNYTPSVLLAASRSSERSISASISDAVRQVTLLFTR